MKIEKEKTIIYLTKTQKAKLKKLAFNESLSMNSFIVKKLKLGI